MKLLATKKADQNAAALDPWTVVHLGSGMALGLVGVGFLPSAALAVGYEIAEQLAERKKWGSKFFRTSGPETGVNVAIDLLVFGAGWWIGRRYNKS